LIVKRKVIVGIVSGALGIAALLIGCVGSRQPMGAAVDTDQNVLTGGPITGVTLEDLPNAVKHELRLQVPKGEVADIDRLTNGREAVFQFSFTDPDSNPKLFIAQNGRVITNTASFEAPGK
jgi:hypothetical protein